MGRKMSFRGRALPCLILSILFISSILNVQMLVNWSVCVSIMYSNFGSISIFKCCKIAFVQYSICLDNRQYVIIIYV